MPYQYVPGDCSYTTVHGKLQRERGPASAHSCSECGGSAQQWAYDGQDPEDQIDFRGRVYTWNLDHYVPMCVRCHRRFDAREKCQRGHEFTEENTYWYRGYRNCRTCGRDARRRFRERRQPSGNTKTSGASE